MAGQTWDCPKCGTLQIIGDLETCPVCGAPRPEDVAAEAETSGSGATGEVSPEASGDPPTEASQSPPSPPASTSKSRSKSSG